MNEYLTSEVNVFCRILVYVFSMAVMLSFVPQPAKADSVTMTNGDRLTGDINNPTKGKIYLVTSNK